MVPQIPFFHLSSLLVVLLGVGSVGLLHDGPAPPQVAPLESVLEAPAPPATADGASQALARAAALRRLGDLEAATEALRPFADSPDPAQAAEVGFRLAQLRLELGFPKEAAGALDNWLARYADQPGTSPERAEFLLGVARRRDGDCAGAAAAFDRYKARSGLLAPNVGLQLATCYQQAGDATAALAAAETASQPGGARLMRIDALEIAAGLLEKNGDRAGAIAKYEQIISLAREGSYKADIRLSAARLNQELGRNAEAVAHLVAVVTQQPTASGAPTALDRLAALGAQNEVSYFQAGLVRLYGRDYAAALRNFDGALASPGEAANQPAAALNRAIARVRQGAELDAAGDLLALPGLFPSSRYASEALLRAGKLLEYNGRLADAADAYRRLARDFPASDEAGEGLYRLGFALLLRGAPAEAAAAWSELGTSGAASGWRALGLFWQAKLEAQAGDVAAARAHWQQAADLAPTAYGGIRARDLLDGNPGGLAGGSPLDAGRVEISPDELAELDAWTTARGAGLAALAAEEAADPAMARGDALLAIGLKSAPDYEFDDLAGRYTGDPARLAGLALALHQRGRDVAALRQAQSALTAAHLSVAEAPVALRKLLYPLPYLDALQAQSQRQGFDPLLFASLVRQESLFDADAKSSANALGLTQVVPSTAREIAGALGRSNFEVNDLFKPSVSLEFGAFYFGQRLKRFGGAIFPALAAYNAGDGSSDRWLGAYGSADMDVFAERIPYSETNHYVKVIYENYGLYRALYGGT